MKFEELRTANKLRLIHFKNGKGKPAHESHDGSDWTIAEWTNAMAGEVGEACNVSKKIRRGDFDDDMELGIGLLLDEIADAVIYADLCCQRIGKKLEIAIVNKFNATSEKVGSPIHLSLDKN